MASFPESVSMALFCDFENVALGVRDAKYDKFDIMPVLERLLLKGSIVVKKAYCDWDRYKGFKAAMHEASFELIEIPHVRQSGKNSADIRLVVDALDLCYTKSHVDTFVIISGDSDFSPLVSKLRENAKKVIGVGVKNSTSDLLVANCDEFIFYDDLVREQQRAIAKREAREARDARDANSAASSTSSAKRTSDEDRQPKQELEGRKAKAIAIAVETFDDLASERGESGKIWASVLKSAIKRRKPDFNESYYGFRAFGNLLEEAQLRGLLEVGRDEKSGAYVYRSQAAAGVETVREVETPAAPRESRQAAKSGGERNRRKGRNVRQSVSEPLFDESHEAHPEAHPEAPQDEPFFEQLPVIAEEPHAVEEPMIVPIPVIQEREEEALARLSEVREAQQPKRGTARRGRQAAAKKVAAKTPQEEPAVVTVAAQTKTEAVDSPDQPAAAPAAKKAAAKTPRKTAPRSRRPQKTAAAASEE
jgi:uncharacterized protein (TIGR00288 family)